MKHLFLSLGGFWDSVGQGAPKGFSKISNFVLPELRVPKTVQLPHGALKIPPSQHSCSLLKISSRWHVLVVGRSVFF